MENTHENKVRGGLSLIPLIVFVGVFLGCGVVFNDFYKFPSPVAALCGIVVAFIIFKKSLQEKINIFIKGCGQSTIITMCVIYLLAGGFASMSKEIGSVNAIVYYGANYLSLQYLYAGTFLIAAFLSFASGTSVGSIATLAPAIVGFTDIPSVHIPLLAAALLGGAMFGDNLSFISDTTIATTQTQGCSMKDKFRTNAKIAIPSALITLVLLTILGFYYHDANMNLNGIVNQPSSFLLIIPYVSVILLALFGVNVFIVLFLGILITIPFGLIEQMDLMTAAQTIYNGFLGMNEIFLLSMLTGGLAYMVDKEGGIEYIFKQTDKLINSKFKAKFGISALVGLINSAVANNTISIIITAPVAKKISTNYGIKPTHTASILDISACIIQGVIPYGAQVLLLIKIVGVSKVGYVELISQTYYLWILAIAAFVYFKWISKRIVKPNTEIA